MAKQGRQVQSSPSFLFNRQKRSWSFSPAGFDAMTIRNAGAAVTVNGKLRHIGQATRAHFADAGVAQDALGTRRVFVACYDFEDPSFTLRMRYEVDRRGRHFVVDSELTNGTEDTLILGDWSLVSVASRRGGGLPLGADPQQATFLQFRPWDTFVKRVGSDRGRHTSEFLCHVHNGACRSVLLAGFITLDRIRCEHRLRVSSGGEVTSYEACCVFRNHELPAGQTIASERLYIELSRDPHAALDKWAELVQARYRPKLNPKTTVGWLGWAWVDMLSKREQRSEDVILGNAAAIRERLPGFDVDYIWMSQVNLKDMAPGNWLEFNEQHFPRGFVRTLKKLQALKFKPGLWIAPFWIFGEAKAALAENREHLVRQKDGTPLVVKTSWEFIQSRGKRRDQFDLFFLDGSHPGARAFMRKVFEAYRRLGVQYYMLDFLGCGRERTVYDKSQTWSQADRALMEGIRRVTRRDTHLLTAVGSTPAYTGCTDAARINTDFGEGRPLYPPFHCLYNATYIINDPYFGNIRKFLQNAASSTFTHRRLYINDCNLMTIDKPVPRSVAEITATVFGLCGSPIMLGDDIRHLHEERLTILKKCLPPGDTTATPVDLFTDCYPDGYTRVLALRVETEWETYTLVGVFNLDAEPYRATLAARQLGLEGRTEYRVFEFWNEAHHGVFRNRFACEVPPVACRLYRISKAKPHPWLLSTDMHVRQGAAEVPSLRWDTDKLILSGTATRPRAERGSLYVIMPHGYRLINHEGHALMKDARDMSVIIRREIAFTRCTMPWKMRFAPLDATTGYAAG